MQRHPTEKRNRVIYEPGDRGFDLGNCQLSRVHGIGDKEKFSNGESSLFKSCFLEVQQLRKTRDNDREKF